MRKLIRADLRRILKKVNVWVLFIVSAFLCAMSVFIGYVSNPIWNGLVFVNKGVPAPIVYLLTSLAVLLGVYGDDQKSGALSTVIGRGFSRTKVVFAKFLDSVILLFGMFLIMAVFNYFIAIVLGTHMTAFETKAYILQYLQNVCALLGYVTISAMFIYLTNSMPLGIILDIVLIILLSTMKSLLNAIFIVKRYNLTRYDLDGFLRNAYSNFMLGMTGRGIISFVLGMVIFVGGAVALSQLIFHVKELEF